MRCYSRPVFFARSSDGSWTSEVAKLLLQKYLAGIPAAFISSSKVSFLIPTSLLVFKSVIINDIVFGCTASPSSGIGKILFPLKYCVYLALSFAQSWGFFLVCADQETSVSGTFWASSVELAGSDNDDAGDGKGHCSSGFFEEGLRPSNKSNGECVGDVKVKSPP